MTALRIGIAGFGTVGGAVARLLLRDADRLAARAGGPLHIARVAVRDLAKPRSVALPAGCVGADALALALDPTLDIVVEVMGGLEPARSVALAALQRGAHFVTANKQLLAAHGAELAAAAGRGGGAVHCEAAVAGAIPIVRAVSHALAGDRVVGVAGIVNGTTNYILTQMGRHGVDFGTALAGARELGYAEADPTNDIGGHDAAAKLAVLAGIAFQCELQTQDVYTEGIADITQADVVAARELGFCIKLLAVARRQGTGLQARVHPALVPLSHPLAGVHDAYNAVLVEAEAAGALMFYGRGAGAEPTASAVLANLVDAAQDIRRGIGGRIEQPLQRVPLIDIGDVESRFCLSVGVADQPGVLGAIATVLGQHGVSVASMFQKGRSAEPIDLVFLTHTVRERQMRAALHAIVALPMVRRIAHVLRVADIGGGP
ncbi:MAG: homoserine dehydrogenase [Myxococcales bacterium]|nr:homoserine dehydrogenase [Myxococcales bacterium]